jgi:hypothetical protein
VSVGFTVLETENAAPFDVPPPPGAAVDVDSFGQAPSADETADEAELEPVLLAPEEQAVRTSPRARAPDVATVRARRLRMAMTFSFHASKETDVAYPFHQTLTPKRIQRIHLLRGYHEAAGPATTRCHGAKP